MSADLPRILEIVEASTAGVRHYVTSLAVGLRNRGMDIAVAAPHLRRDNYGDVAFAEDLARHEIPFYPVSMQRRIGPWDVTSLAAIWRLLQQGQFAVVHTHSSKAGFLGRIAARASNVPVIHTPNGLYFLEKTGLSRQFYLNLERLAGRLTTRMIAVSANEKDVLVRNRIVEPACIQVIRNGVDVGLMDKVARLSQAEARSRLGIRADQHVVGSVGRLVTQKDPLSFVQVARRVSNDFPETAFVWVGSGPLHAEVEAQASAHGVPLRLLGHREDAWLIMQAFDVFVLSSRYEGLSFALLEALALSLPVVATDVVGNRDVIRDQVSGLLVPPNAPEATADAVTSLLRDPQRAMDLAAAGRQEVVREFSLERMLDEHQALYEELYTRRVGG
jgi:glycosyltransferase involved in cell wall biosynthesis